MLWEIIGRHLKVREEKKNSNRIIRPTEFNQEAYLKRRNEYIHNLEKYLSEKNEENDDEEQS